MNSKVRKTSFRIMGYTLLLGVTSLFLGYFSLTNYYFLPKIEKEQSRLKTHLPELLKDLRLLSEEPIFPVAHHKKNAEVLLSQYLSWEGDGLSPLSSSSHTSMRSLFEKHPNWVSDQEQFKSLYDDPLLMAIDTSWLESINEYTHWNFSEHQKVQAHLKKLSNLDGIARLGVFARLPVPNILELRKWAMTYLLQQSRKNSKVQGFEVYRKVAELSFSSGTLLGNMVAVAMLKDEHFFAEQLKHTSWPLISKTKVQTLKRVSWAWGGILESMWFSEFPKEIKAYLTPSSGVCAAAWERSASLSAFESFFGSKVVFEKDFVQNVERSKKLQKKLLSDCNMKAYEQFITRIPAEARPLIGRGYNNLLTVDGRKHSTSLAINWSRVPYLRQIVGLNLFTRTTPNYWRMYE